jgi:hypothetical protein
MKFHLFSFFLAMLCAATLPAQIVINEYSAANHAQFSDNFQGHEDWIELYNAGDASVTIGGWGITDNPNTLGKWKFPATATIASKGFVRLWCSGRDTSLAANHYHTNFKLTQTKGTPEKITLTNAQNNILDQVEVRKTDRHQSRCRQTDGATEWMICTQPSPRASNDGKTMFARFVDRPTVDKEAGFYADSVKVSISTDEPNGTIRYTLNGEEPLVTSAEYTGQITIKNTTVLKARVFSADTSALPSFIRFHTYFINESHSMEVLSIAADDLLTLANGDNMLRPIGSMEYFGKDKQLIDRVYGELNSHGQDSWANDQRSLDWITRDEFGYTDVIEAKIFSGSPRDEFQRIILRASGDDNYPAANRSTNEGCAHMRDDYVQALASLADLHLDTRRTERCIVYLNGEYWGVYSFREKIDDHDYMGAYYDQGKYDIQMVLTWGDTWSEYGGSKSITDWRALRTYILNNNMADSSKYAYVESQMDFLSLIDYFFVNTSSVCSDWLNYNTGWWRGLDPAGGHKKWGYILWDNDATFGFYINYTGVPDTSPTATPCDINDFDTQWGNPDPERHIQILNKLRTNPKFDQLYLSRHADLYNTTYSCDNMLHVLDSMVAVIQPEMQRHADRWFGTYQGWQQNVARLRYFIERRCLLTDEGMLTCDTILNGPHEIHFMTEPAGMGSIQVNTLAAQAQPWSGLYYEGMPNLLTAMPTPATGFVFSHWEGKNSAFSIDSSKQTVQAYFAAPDTVIAHFKPFSSGLNDLGNQLEWSVYPTIFHTTLNVNFDHTEAVPCSMMVYDAFGREVFRHDAGTTNAIHTNLFLPADLATGMYYMRLQAGEMTGLKKLVKQAE